MKFKVGDKVRIKPSKDFHDFKRKKFEVTEINDDYEYPIVITRNNEYFCFKHEELELINE